MSEPLLDRMERLDREATPGPWRLEDEAAGGGPADYGDDDVCGWVFPIGAYSGERADNALIAEMRNALPLLVAVARAAQEIVLYGEHPSVLAHPGTQAMGKHLVSRDACARLELALAALDAGEGEA